MSDAPLGESERAELERLRADAAGRSRPVHRHSTARWFGAVVALVLAAVLGMLSVVVGYARDALLDTDRYVQMVAPLAEDPDVQAAVATRISSEINKKLDLKAHVDQVVAALETRGAPEVLATLAGPVTSSLEGFVADEVGKFVRSDKFAQLWDQANTTVHTQITALLEGESTELLVVKGDTLYLELGPVIDQVKTRLVDRGLALAEQLPAISVQFPLMEVPGLPNAQGLASLLNTLAWVLPIAALVLFALGAYAAPNRRRALLIGALMVAVAMLLLLFAVAVGRTVLLAHLPADVRSPQAVAAVFDILVRFLISAAKSLLVLALIAAIAAWLVGPGRIASAIRRGLRRGRDGIASGLDRTGLPLGATSRFTAHYLRALEFAVVVLAIGWLLWLSNPGVGDVLWVAAAAVVAVAILEVLARTSPADTEPMPL
jgi:hypothetical protein